MAKSMVGYFGKPCHTFHHFLT
jgi:hypothetical protein